MLNKSITSTITSIYTNNEEGKIKLNELFTSLNEQQFLSVWNYCLNTQNRNLGSKMFLELYSKHPLFMKNEQQFFEEYVLIHDNTPLFKDSIHWFITYSSAKWIYEDNYPAFPYILSLMLAKEDPKKGSNKIKKIFCNLISSLSETKFNEFLENKIFVLSEQNQFNFLILYFQHADSKYFHELSHHYLDNLTKTQRNELGWTILIKDNISLTEHYLPLVIEGINSKISETPQAINLGRFIGNKTLKCLYSIYEQLDNKHVDNFINNTLYQALLSRHNISLIETSLQAREEKPHILKLDTLVFFIWRSIHTFHKAQQEIIIEKIIQNTDKTGEFEAFKKIILNSSEQVKFCHTTMKLDNEVFKAHMKQFLFHTLNEKLVEKPASIKRTKI